MSETLPEETLEEYAQKTGIPLEVLRRQLQRAGRGSSSTPWGLRSRITGRTP